MSDTLDTGDRIDAALRAADKAGWDRAMEKAAEYHKDQARRWNDEALVAETEGRAADVEYWNDAASDEHEHAAAIRSLPYTPAGSDTDPSRNTEGKSR